MEEDLFGEVLLDSGPTDPWLWLLISLAGLAGLFIAHAIAMVFLRWRAHRAAQSGDN
jgi:hypothetical protein